MLLPALRTGTLALTRHCRPPTGRSSSGRPATASRRRRSPPWKDAAEGAVEAAGRRRAQLAGRRRRRRVRLLQAEGQGRRRAGRVRRRRPARRSGRRATTGRSSPRRSATARAARPAVDGGKVYTLGNTGVLACWDATTGDIAWKVDTLKEFKAKNLFFGVSTSPTVVGDERGRDGRRQGGRASSRSTRRPARWRGRRPTTRPATPARCTEPRQGHAARVPDRQPPARRCSADGKAAVGGPVQGPAQRELDHAGEGRRPDRRQLGDGRQRRR